MAHPKQKLSKARSAKRAANWGTVKVTVTACPKCKADKLPHYACPKCGYSKKSKSGEVVKLDIKEKKAKE